jgi:hypothetical protein
VIIELGVCQDQSRQINDLPGGRGFGEGQDLERTALVGWDTELDLLRAAIAELTPCG